MSEPGLGCWVLAQSLAWSRGKLHWQEYQCLVPGGYVIYQLRHFGQRTSPLGASSGKLTGGAVGKMTLIGVSGVLAAAKTAGIFLGDV